MTRKLDEPSGARRDTFVDLPTGVFRLENLGSNVAILAAILLLASSAWLAFFNLYDVRRSDTLAAQSQAAQALLDPLRSTLTDAETGQRGYLLTGNSSYLEPYEAAKRRLPAELVRLQARLQADEQIPHVARILRLAAAKMDELARTLGLARAGQRQAALTLLRTSKGKQIMDALRVEIDALTPRTSAAQRQERAQARSAWPRAAVVALGVLSSVLMAAVGLGQRRQRRAVSASLASLKRFTRAFGSSQGLLRALSGTITFWARGMERLYGYTAHEAVGRSSDELLNTEYSTPRAQIQATLEREGHWEGDVVMHRRDGTNIEVATQWSLDPGEKGQSDAVIVLDNDISQTRRAERADERSNLLLRTIVEAAPGPIYAKDRQGNMLLANAGALRLIGQHGPDVEGRAGVNLIANSAQADLVMANDRRIMDAGQVEQLEEEVVDSDGVARVWLSTKTPIRNSAGKVSGLVDVSVEITELKARADALAKLNIELNNALADRDVALQQRDMLLREVYHRVKNNLQIIDGLLVMQARQLKDPHGRIALLGLRNRLHALALVHHQLMHSKNLKTFDIAPFLQELASTIIEGGTEGGISLSISAIPLEVDLDFAIPIGLLVAELVTNSIKHAFPSGKGKITVILERRTNGEIALIVSDNGQGWPPGTAIQGVNGPGLGTRIINGLVNQLHGAQIMNNDRGARTEIRVPAPAPS